MSDDPEQSYSNCPESEDWIIEPFTLSEADAAFMKAKQEFDRELFDL